MKIQLYADLQATRSCQRRGRACYAYRYFIPPLLTCFVRADFFTRMKNKVTKPKKHFKASKGKSENVKCTCIDKGDISSSCSENGICPTLKIIGLRGFKYKDRRGIRKELKAFGKGIEAFRKIFKSMRKKT